MNKIVVKNKQLANFVELIGLKGEIENKEALITVSKDSISAKALSSNNIVATRGTLKGTFDDWGEIGIDNLILLKNFLNSLTSNDLTINLDKNKLVLTSGKVEFSSVLRNTQYIVNNIADDKFLSLLDKSKGNGFLLKQDVVKQIVNHFNAMNPNVITLAGSGKKLTLKLVNNQNELKVEFDLEHEVEAFSVKLARLFIDLLSIIPFDIQVSIKNSAPILLTGGDSDYKFEYVVAPIGK